MYLGRDAPHCSEILRMQIRDGDGQVSDNYQSDLGRVVTQKRALNSVQNLLKQPNFVPSKKVRMYDHPAFWGRRPREESR